MKLSKIFLLILLVYCSNTYAQTEVKELDLWKFYKGDNVYASQTDFDDTEWESVTIPHDWAIYGPFDKEIDKQIVEIEQNGEKVSLEKTGRTGALPFVGVGWYRTNLSLPDFNNAKQALLTFDGAMSNAEVFVNGKKVGNRPYGYSYFYFNISDYIHEGMQNVIAVRLENQAFSSRWYPGAGLYRKVRVIVKNKVCFKHWGHFITTPFISEDLAKINICTQLQGENVSITTFIRDEDGNIVAENIADQRFADEIEQNIAVKNPKLWSLESPYLYTAEIKLYQGDVLKDTELVRFGIREIKYTATNGFELNGQKTKFKGVCLHHDLGPIGTAVNRAALKRQLTILKDLGCNAIRSSHNMPSIEQLELCDEMGFLFLAESFDEWKIPKVKNGYSLYFDDWAEKDLVNLVRTTRNHPCIVMWSAGNEVPDQWGNEGVKRLKWLQDVFHREDPTRPVTVGMDQVKAVLENGFGAILDVPGLNYRSHLYEEAYEKFPQGILLGSETASTVSSRGVYKFPVVNESGKTYPDLQCSSYDLEYCNWSNIPEDDFILQDDKPWVIGEFVWTGFDYLGEPTPYIIYWPTRSSYFGICDLAGLPKDRYYLYRSRWNTTDETLHILPHWNWEGRDGDTIPVFVYTNYNSAELFINGKSWGIQKKSDKSKLNRYRLMWMDVNYEPGTLKVVAHNDQGEVVAEKTVVTAGKPHHIKLEADRLSIKANGKDLSYVTATIVDKNGNPCPKASNRLYFEVKGNGKFRASCNGDATSLEIFHKPTMKAFNGKLVVLIQSSIQAGDIELKISGDQLKKEKILISSLKQ
ncbi:MAG: glycoside hydrolase family 2 protein [Bacteroidetes bacterium]|jgi:beta-galactosidase|nr:glycoside hydrolase family 2 protein [Bacteroidota bacterium]MBT6686834.1 glycoside hydrolase family 2 protein [Bacteroidota bacterium]MBT7144163.1 glycoside hydrolase family 2 protein [Bacteroidota bacterium]MBT7491882.1 glycoside hydrolase family 2 protein [Bacteroidota bacterium]